MLKRKVEDRVLDLLILASEFKDFDIPEIRFDLRGRSAGQCFYNGAYVLRFNLKLLEENTEDFLRFIVPHEVAHYVSHELAGKIQPHGVEWQTIMKYFGIENPLRCHNFEMTEAPWEYRCSCQTHFLYNKQHLRVSGDGYYYVCNDCKTKLVFIGKRTCLGL